MARFGRRYPAQSKLRRPATIGPAVVFRALQLWLSDRQKPKQVVTRRASHSKVRPPAPYISAATVFRPIDVTTVRQPRRYQHTIYRVEPPADVTQVVFRPVETTLVRRPRQAGDTFSRLAPPTVVTPAVVAATVFDPVRVTIADRTKAAQIVGRRAPLSRLPDVIVDVDPGVVGERVVLTRLRRVRLETHSRLSPPTAVDAAAADFTARPVAVTLADQPKRSRIVQHRLAPPIFEAFAARPVAVILADQPKRSRLVQHHLAPPTVLDAADVPRPIDITRAPRPKYERPVIHRVSPPGTFEVDPGVTQMRIGRATVPRARLNVISRLSAPVVVAPPVTFRPLNITMTRPMPPARFDSRRKPHGRLAAPTVVDPFVTPSTTTPLRTLLGVGL